MTHASLSFFSPVGRLLLASLFVMAGIGKLTAPEATAGYMASGGLPSSAMLAMAVGLLELLGGLAILLGFKARWAALALAAFTLLASLLFHNYWSAPADQQFMQQLLFSKNIAVAGALFFLAAVGAGPWSLDSRIDASTESPQGALAR